MLQEIAAKPLSEEVIADPDLPSLPQLYNVCQSASTLYCFVLVADRLPAVSVLFLLHVLATCSISSCLIVRCFPSTILVVLSTVVTTAYGPDKCGFRRLHVVLYATSLLLLIHMKA